MHHQTIGGYVKEHKDEEIWFRLLHVARRLNLEKVFAKVAGNRGSTRWRKNIRYCAALGGKTTAIASLMKDKG
ncbi:hypothetical protein L2E82_12542 [Cichorium intybus]|uniref:Uncharacterized protein n=1 Tax=Cichorium intybus TaxID=13427 RepID=A0ACB9GGD5_CICIN|nr:hypothetical protein L2E82_12542 [Cichorium intybus]